MDTVMVTSTTYGLVLLSVFMGYGIVGVPFYLALRADKNRRFQIELCKVDTMEERRQQASLLLEELYQTAISLRKHRLEPEEQELISQSIALL